MYTCLVEISLFRMDGRFYQRFDKQNAPNALLKRNNAAATAVDVPDAQFIVRRYYHKPLT